MPGSARPRRPAARRLHICRAHDISPMLRVERGVASCSAVRAQGGAREHEHWPAYRRPAGLLWQMNQSRQVIYENPDAEVQADWKAEQILKMMRRNQIIPRRVCEIGVLSQQIVEKFQMKIGDECKVWGH